MPEITPDAAMSYPGYVLSLLADLGAAKAVDGVVLGTHLGLINL